MPALRPKFWKELNDIFAQHNGKKANGTVASAATQAKRRTAIKEGFNVLAKEFHCRLVSPRQFKERHMFKLVGHWEEKRCADIQTRIGYFRTFGNVWLGKGGGNMIKDSAKYAKNPESVRRRYVTNIDKTWSGNGADMVEKTRIVTALDPIVGGVFELCATFGLRLKEALLFRPHLDDHGDRIFVRCGKGGRSRFVHLEMEGPLRDYQREVLARLKRIVTNSAASMIPDDKTFVSGRRRVYYILDKAGIGRKLNGVTLHGLRHEYAVAYYQTHLNVAAPMKDDHQKPDPQLEQQVKEDLSENLGHSRTHIVGCYIGSRHQRRPSDHTGTNIKKET